MKRFARVASCCLILLSCTGGPAPKSRVPLILPGLILPSGTLPSPDLTRSGIPARVIDLAMDAVYTPGPVRVNAVHHVTIPVMDHPSQILLSISASGQTGAGVFRHKNSIDRYLGLSFTLSNAAPLTLTTVFRILVLPLDYSSYLVNNPGLGNRPDETEWSMPSQYIESDHPLIVAIAGEMRRQTSAPLALARQAWAWPSRHLRFAPQTQARGAVYAAQHKTGDCTEYAALTTAICRATGIPARMTAVFTLGDARERTFALPNHSAIEAFLPDRQGNGLWLPLDPNLSLGRMDSIHGFGKTANTVIRFSREGSWTWGNSIPKHIRQQAGFGVSVRWTARVIDEGQAGALFSRYQR
ncbi:MAG TPA: transglutaminase-like domain-containing protein [Spirochaetota bacterium]|nr:transglutaminase-like domain-containing protein [Spirochaetota bacterium]